jgi:hypothetical protein
VNRLPIVALALSLSACGGGGGATYLNASSTLVTVDGSTGAPLPGITVTLSSGVNGITPDGVIATGVTNALGFVTFTLPSRSPLCVSATLGTNPLVFESECRPAPFPSAVTLQP